MNHQMIIKLNDESRDIHGEDGYTLKAQRILSSLLDANTSLRIGKSVSVRIICVLLQW